VGDPRLAEDVAQETFLRAWQRAGAFDPRRGTVVSWLLAIARNLAIDTVRLRRIVIVDPDELTRADHAFLDERFLNQILLIVTPIAIDPAHPFPFIPNRGFCLALELRRRSGQEERSLIEALPEILASGMTFGSEPNLRHLDTMPPIPATTGRRLIDRIMDDGILTQLPELTDDELTEAIERVQEVEAELSAQRRQLHEVIDALQDEIIARYRSQQGEAQPAG